MDPPAFPPQPETESQSLQQLQLQLQQSQSQPQRLKLKRRRQLAGKNIIFYICLVIGASILSLTFQTKYFLGDL